MTLSQSWIDPAWAIPAIAGLVGAAIGGLCTLWAATRQTRMQFERQASERRSATAGQMAGLKILIASARSSEQVVEAALRARQFFLEYPEQLNEPDNAEYFQKYLSGVHDISQLASWTDEKQDLFLFDSGDLKPWNGSATTPA
ncbi:MAG: hypothetical protein ACLQVL_31845 [Terriglobia bacterium]